MYFDVQCLADYYTHWLESFQDFLIQLDIKRHMHLLEISTFSLNNVTIRHTKIMNSADNNWAHLKKLKYSKNQNF